MVTSQELFDAALFNLRKQGVAAVDENDQCKYRTPQGHKCAAGWCIPDELYSPSMEDITIDQLTLDFQSLSYLYFHKEFLREMQRAHDRYMPIKGQGVTVPYRSMEIWEEEMKKIAGYHKLSYVPPASENN